MNTGMTFIHLFIYPFLCGIIAAAAVFTVYKREYWPIALAVLAFFAMVLISLTAYVNYLELL